MVGSNDRLFLGIALTEEVRRNLWSQLQAEEIPGRIVPPENWHLTLRFLGDTPREALDRLVQALGTEVLGSRTAITFGGFGAFPRATRASVLWLGVGEGAEALCTRAARVEEVTRRAGFPSDVRPFTPHLTLSRIRPARDVRRLVERTPLSIERMPVEALVLFRSRLGRGPAHYEELEHFPLAPVS